MDMERNAVPAELAARRTLELRNAEGVCLTCLEGMLWITLEHDTRDIVLAAGESFRVDRAGLTLVHALRPSRIRMAERAACGRAPGPRLAVAAA